MPGELFYPLAHAEHVLGQIEPAAFFEDGNQFVELRPGVRTGDDDANGMKQFFTLCAGLGFYFIHQLLESFGRELPGIGAIRLPES